MKLKRKEIEQLDKEVKFGFNKNFYNSTRTVCSSLELITHI